LSNRKVDAREARRLRREGLSYAAIGRVFGASETAARVACDPAQAKRRREYTRRRGYITNNHSGLYRHPPSNEDESVRCAICGRVFYALSRHLLTQHGVTASEYRQRFPNSDTVSRQYRQHFRELASLRGFESWDKPSIVSAIRSWAAKYGSPPSAKEWATTGIRKKRPGRKGPRPSKTTVQKHFGSWNAAIVAAGFPPLAPGTFTPRRRRVGGDALGRRRRKRKTTSDPARERRTL
jgi:hypothetical protein